MPPDGLLEPEEGPRDTVPGAMDATPVAVKLQPDESARSRLLVSLAKASGGIA